MMDETKHNSTTVSITVLDVNDNYPIFDPQQYNINVTENSEIGMSIWTVSADDADEVH